MSSYLETTVIELSIPTQVRSEIPFIVDDFTLALHLGVRCKTLWACVITKENLYKRFSIRKSNGKRRILHAPMRILKYVQKRIDQVILKKLPVLDCVGAYVTGRSCRYSAERHSGHAVRIGMDLKDFFPTHTKAQVRRFFHETCGYSHFVSGLLADVCTTVDKIPADKSKLFGETRKRHFVPQGSPASPSLCNLMAQERLDKPLLAFLEGTGWVYTRYSDDLTFSHPEEKSRKEVDAFIDRVRHFIRLGGYRTNMRKTKVQRRVWRQKMLGMVVNEHPNIPRDVFYRYKAILYNCIRDGFLVNAIRYGQGFEDAPQSFPSHLQGKISYFHTVNPTKAKKLSVLLARAVAAERRRKGEDAVDETIDGDFPTLHTFNDDLQSG